MFSQVSVILFTGGCIPACIGADPPLARHHPPGRHPPWINTPATATAEDVTHPTGMHSCFNLVSQPVFKSGNIVKTECNIMLTSITYALDLVRNLFNMY